MPTPLHNSIFTLEHRPFNTMNFIYFNPDEMRADVLGCYGHELARTPHFDRLAGLEARHTHFARNMSAQLSGAPGKAGRAVFAEGGYDIHEPQCFEGSAKDNLLGDERGIYYPKALQQQEKPDTICRSTMMRTTDWKLIRRTNGRHELYDLHNDPAEHRNLYGAGNVRDVMAELEQRMLDWYIRTSDTVPTERNSRNFA